MSSADLKSLIESLPTMPGVYRLIGADGDILYVGKARNVRQRVRHYIRPSGLSGRTTAMMRQVRDIGVTVTHTEDEALLLENNLIKTWRPRFNVQLRDDKSYPYILVADRQEFPRLAFYRGARREPGRYFGPYPSASAVRASLNIIQKIFRVRQCEDSFFRNRSRPCLQYQIKRCSAPCVGLIDAAAYGEDVRHALMFLEGRSRALGDELIKRMEQASAREEYESAAVFRDRIAAIKQIERHQFVSGSQGDADVLAAAVRGDTACVVVTYVRGGLNIGDKTFFPKPGAHRETAEILTAFVTQYYLAEHSGANRTIPGRIYVNEPIVHRTLIERVFSQQVRKKVRIDVAKRGIAKRWVQMAQRNAVDALRRQIGVRTDQLRRLEALGEALELDAMPERIECFDVSHTLGEAAVAACVVFDRAGALKSEYRRYNIEGIVGGDDYAALRQALERRYRRIKEGEGRTPDLLVIDGGKGQVAVAEAALRELQIIAGLRIIGVAKGPARRAGEERIFLSGRNRPTILPPDSGALHLIQQVRDEAHRFAIAGHRQRRARARNISPLECISGIGPRRRQALLKSFGGIRGLARAGVHDLAQVPGISADLARRVFDVLHEEKN